MTHTMAVELVRKRIRAGSRFLVLTKVLLQVTQCSGILGLTYLPKRHCVTS